MEYWKIILIIFIGLIAWIIITNIINKTGREGTGFMSVLKTLKDICCGGR